MIKDKDFFCQFNSFSNKDIAKVACGITCIAMILSCEKGTNSIVSNGKLDKLFAVVAKLHKNNIPSVKRKYKFDDFEIYLTIGFDEKLKKEATDKYESDNEFNPVFVVYRGYDHRASKQIFEMYKISASIVENLSTNALYQNLKSLTYKYFMASIMSKYKDPNAISIPTHIVLIDYVFEKDGNKYISYIDPGEKNIKLARNTVEISDFEKIFNGYGTAIHQKNYAAN